MAFRTYRAATWADVQAGDTIRTTSGAEFRVTDKLGASVQMVGLADSRPYMGSPRSDGPVEIRNRNRAEEPCESDCEATHEPEPPACGEGNIPAMRARSERLAADLDALAMSTAVALVQLRLSGQVLAEQLDGQPLACGPAREMDVEHLRAHLLSHHGLDEDLDEPFTVEQLRNWHDKGGYASGQMARIPHDHLPF